MTAKTLRIGFVGAGGNTRARHLPLLKRIPGVELVAVANRTRESAAKVATEFGIARVEDDWRAVVEASDVDAVVIGTWPYLHAEVTIAALRAGKHVLTEARMARDAAEAGLMLAESRGHPALVAQIVPSPFSLDVDSTVADILERGEIGRIREVVLVHTTASVADSAARQTWRQDFELSGFNTLTLGIYYEIAQRWLRRDPETIIADAAVHTPSRPAVEGQGMAEIQIPDSVTFSGQYAADAAVFAPGARIVGHFSGVERGQPRNEVRVNGEKGTLRFDVGRQELFITTEGAEQTANVPAEARRGWRVEEDFVESIRTGAPVRLTDFASGLRYMRVTEAIWRSWSEGGVRTKV
ncbi:MAG TPA: Gfo/Idh/MocA family oxidoreductase [Opitutaceae bacterium]|nr:Gfo/Idh/MocA family oxidoreductase [Opitutaceae bacterium]